MLFVQHMLIGVLTMGQVDSSAVAPGRHSPGPAKPPDVALQESPSLSIPIVEPSQDAQTSPTDLASQGVETLPALTPIGPTAKTPEVAETGQTQQGTPGAEASSSTAACPSTRHLAHIWGLAGGTLYYGGTRMAPNGFAYSPLASLDLDLNVELIPHKKFYLFATTDFWLQRATAGQTQSNYDFTKREYDIDVGVAWNYWGALELRGFAFGLNNINRGNSPLLPSGYNDGGGIENRYYFPTDDIYDIPRQSFVSIGYMPSKTLTGGDGLPFNPGLFARAYLARDLPIWHSYVYADTGFICESDLALRLLTMDVGVAARPLSFLENLEFRLGATDTYDVKPAINRGMGYFGVRFVF